MARKRPRYEAEDRSLYPNDTTRSDNEVDGPVPAHPSGGTESTHLRCRNCSKGLLTQLSQFLLASESILCRREVIGFSDRALFQGLQSETRGPSERMRAAM